MLLYFVFKKNLFYFSDSPFVRGRFYLGIGSSEKSTFIATIYDRIPNRSSSSRGREYVIRTCAVVNLD